MKNFRSLVVLKRPQHELWSVMRDHLVEFAGSLSHWMLTLVPRDARVASKISKVRIEGVRDNLITVEIFQTDGDRSLTTLRDHPIP